MFGAVIERGTVTEAVTESGTTICRVDSLDRPGVMGHGLVCLHGEPEEGDRVYFFMFADGTGMVVGKIPGIE